jgi:hypothetical protein
VCVLCDGEELVTDFSVKRSYRGEVLVMPEGAPPLQGEWQTAKNGKRYFKTTQPGVMKYGRASSAGEHLKGSGDGLANWKAAMAAIGTVMSDSVRSEIANLINRYDGDPYYKGNDGGWQSGKSQLLAAVDKACEIGGSSTASSRGTEFHHLAELVNSGQTPRIVQPHLVEHLEHYQQVMAPVKFLAQEILIVNDLLGRAGSIDYLMELPAGVETPEGRSDKPLVVAGDLKGLPLTTKIPTPSGWSTIGQLSVGDKVFGSDGKPCTVTAKSDVKDIGTYIVKFDDGSSVPCDSEHLWWVFEGWSNYMNETVISVTEMFKQFQRKESGDNGPYFRVPVTRRLELPDVELPIDPYLLGAWLGDGNRGRGVITKFDEFFKILESDGHKLGVRYADKRSGAVTRTVLGLQTKLIASGLMKNKHIPQSYLRSSADQRVRLLQGLMDTDGSWNIARNSATFNTVNKELGESVEELLCTLGQRPRLYEYKVTGFGRRVTAYCVEFTPVELVPFRLPVKRDKCLKGLAGKNLTKSTRRLVTSIEPGPDVPTACIAVDSSNSTYLCTEKFIPTHNTGKDAPDFVAPIAAQLACYGRGLRYDQETNTRTVLHPDFDDRWGVLVHFPIGQPNARVRLFWVDLSEGLRSALLSKSVGESLKWWKGQAKEFTV